MKPVHGALNSEKSLPFGSVLKSYRKGANLSQGELAGLINVSRNTIINWEANKCKPDYELVPDLCHLLNIPVFELFGMGGESSLSPLEKRVVENLRLLNPSSRRAVDKMVSTLVEEESIARVSEMQANNILFLCWPEAAAAGPGIETQETKPSYVFLRRNAMNAKADGIIRVSGKSMEPFYHSGDYVYYREADTARPGDVVLVLTDEGTVIKRYNSDGTLSSFNPDLPYPDKNDDNTFVIRGVVLGPVSPSDFPAEEDRDRLEEVFADEVRAFRKKHGLDEYA